MGFTERRLEHLRELTQNMPLMPFPNAGRKLCPKCGRWVEVPVYHSGQIIAQGAHGYSSVICGVAKQHMHWDCGCGHRMVTATLDSN